MAHIGQEFAFSLICLFGHDSGAFKLACNFYFFGYVGYDAYKTHHAAKFVELVVPVGLHVDNRAVFFNAFYYKRLRLFVPFHHRKEKFLKIILVVFIYKFPCMPGDNFVVSASEHRT